MQAQTIEVPSQEIHGYEHVIYPTVNGNAGFDFVTPRTILVKSHPGYSHMDKRTNVLKTESFYYGQPGYRAKGDQLEQFCHYELDEHGVPKTDKRGSYVPVRRIKNGEDIIVPYEMPAVPRSGSYSLSVPEDNDVIPNFLRDWRNHSVAFIDEFDASIFQKAYAMHDELEVRRHKKVRNSRRKLAQEKAGKMDIEVRHGLAILFGIDTNEGLEPVSDRGPRRYDPDDLDLAFEKYVSEHYDQFLTDLSAHSETRFLTEVLIEMSFAAEALRFADGYYRMADNGSSEFIAATEEETIAILLSEHGSRTRQLLAEASGYNAFLKSWKAMNDTVPAEKVAAALSERAIEEDLDTAEQALTSRLSEVKPLESAAKGRGK